MLDIVAGYHCIQFQGKLMYQTSENDKMILDLILTTLAQIWILKFFMWILPSLDVRLCRKPSLYAISRRTNEPSLRKWQKTLDFGPFAPNLGCQILFSKIWLPQSLDVTVRHHHVQYQEKLMIQSWENLVTDGQTDWGTDGQEWFHRMLSD